MAVFLALHAGPVRDSLLYFLAAGLILVVSLIQTSYAMAYHDELTGLAGRRAFNETLLRLGSHYVIAVIDVDHFKRFNDTYGHEVGDQVLKWWRPISDWFPVVARPFAMEGRNLPWSS